MMFHPRFLMTSTTAPPSRMWFAISPDGLGSGLVRATFSAARLKRLLVGAAVAVAAAARSARRAAVAAFATGSLISSLVDSLMTAPPRRTGRVRRETQSATCAHDSPDLFSSGRRLPANVICSSSNLSMNPGCAPARWGSSLFKGHGFMLIFPVLLNRSHRPCIGVRGRPADQWILVV